jgi:hypothetical protein
MNSLLQSLISFCVGFILVFTAMQVYEINRVIVNLRERVEILEQNPNIPITEEEFIKLKEEWKKRN